MKISEKELLKQLKHNRKDFDKDYRRIFENFKKDEQHLGWSYETAITLAINSCQEVMVTLGMLEYLLNKRFEQRNKENDNNDY